MGKYGNDKWWLVYCVVLLHYTRMKYVIQIGLHAPIQKVSYIEHCKKHISMYVHVVSVDMLQNMKELDSFIGGLMPGTCYPMHVDNVCLLWNRGFCNTFRSTLATVCHNALTKTNEWLKLSWENCLVWSWPARKRAWRPQNTVLVKTYSNFVPYPRSFVFVVVTIWIKWCRLVYDKICAIHTGIRPRPISGIIIVIQWSIPRDLWVPNRHCFCS